MQRICPACHERLTTNDHFFCGNCGSILESSLIERIDASKKITDLNRMKPKDGEVVEKHIVHKAREVVKVTNLKGIAAALGLLFFIGIPLYLYLYKFQLAMSPVNHPDRSGKVGVTQAVSETSSTKKQLPLTTTVMGYPGLVSYVPYNVDLLLESGDLVNSFGLLATENPYYLELAEALQGKLKPAYIVYAVKQPGTVSWVLMAELTDPEAPPPVLPQKYDWLKYKIVNNVFLFSNNNDLINSSESVAAGLDKSINMNPAFVPLRPKLNTTGKVAIVALTGEGRQLLSADLAEEVPGLLKELLIPYFSEPNNYLVIQ